MEADAGGQSRITEGDSNTTRGTFWPTTWWAFSPRASGSTTSSDKYLKIAAEINPNWPEPWLYMGLNAYAQGDMKRAEEALRKAVS